MGRAPCCAKVGLHRGPWSAKEDALLTQYIQAHGEGQWRSLPKQAGLLRCGKSCRLRWMNYLRPDIKRGNITPEEDDVIIRMHSLLGNKWSLIAARLPGRTDNEIKNYWNTHLCRKFNTQGQDQITQKKQVDNKRKKKIEKRTSPIGYKKQLKNNVQTNENITHYNVYHPKPIRAKPFLAQRNVISSDNNLASASGSSSQEEYAGGLINTTKVGDIFPWQSLENNSQPNGPATSFLIHSDHGNNAINSSEFECQSNVSSTDESLEKLYEEYIQLIMADDDPIQFDGGVL